LIGSTAYYDSTVANRTTYYYATTAVDIYGEESNMSAAVEAVIP
jgi:fibronectin type 3 domain-containing protein